jgi:hypothetical protein
MRSKENNNKTVERITRSKRRRGTEGKWKEIRMRKSTWRRRGRKEGRK